MIDEVFELNGDHVTVVFSSDHLKNLVILTTGNLHHFAKILV